MCVEAVGDLQCANFCRWIIMQVDLCDAYEIRDDREVEIALI